MNDLKHLFFSLFIFGTYNFLAQQNDSLAGFDHGKAVIEAYEKKYSGAETKFFVKYLEREFIKEKYNLRSIYSNPKKQEPLNSKSINPPCLNEDFEAVPTGSLQSSSGWTSTESNNGFPSILCNSVSPTFSQAPTNYAIVVNTPIIDVACNNVAASPFGGTKIVQINKNVNSAKITKISQTFSVTASNWYYSYAYKGVIDGSSHNCCDQPNVIFNFFDCSNNPISSLSKTLVPSATSITCVSSSTLAWSTNSTTWISYTPNWVVVNENLSSYIGSCVTVEIMAVQCNGGSHIGYCYYDAQCNGGAISVNNASITSSTYSTCAYSATLNAVPGFSTYSWSGPPGSGITNNPAVAITATTSGVYTLSAVSGSNTVIQTFTLDVNSLQSNVQISNSTFTICQGNPITLQTSGNNLTSYLWSTGATSSSITIMPTTTTVYSVTATNTLGCVSNDTKTITVNLCTGMKIISKALQRINVYPNPSFDKFTIEGFSNDLIIILDEEGKVINKITLSAEENFSKTLTGFKPGIYFVNTGNESVKIIVK